MTPTINLLACKLAAQQMEDRRLSVWTGKPLETFSRENLETLIQVRNSRYYFDNLETLCTR